MDDRVAEVVVTAEEHGVVEVVFVEEVLEGEVGVALLIFPTSSHQWIRCNCQQRSPLTSRVKLNTVPCQLNLLFSVSSTCSTCDLQPKCDQVHIASVAASLHVEATAIHLGTFFSTDIMWSNDGPVNCLIKN